MTRISLLCLEMLSLCLLECFNPPVNIERKPAEVRDYSPYPKLPQYTTHGEVTQTKNLVSVRGIQWRADGHFVLVDRKYKLILYWYWFPTRDNNMGPAVYSFNEQTRLWEGQWGWEYETEITKDYEVLGNSLRDKLIPRDKYSNGQDAKHR